MKPLKKIKKRIFLNLMKNIFCGITAIAFLGCMNIKSQGDSSGKKLYETFFAGDEGTQYFIKPLIFTSLNNQQLIMDITFRYKNEIKDSATINISLIGNNFSKNVDSLKINSASTKSSLKKLDLLFFERKKDTYHVRFSTKESLANVNKLFNNNDWKIVAHQNNKLTNFATSSTTQKKIANLDYKIFKLF